MGSILGSPYLWAKYKSSGFGKDSDMGTTTTGNYDEKLILLKGVNTEPTTSTRD